MMTLAYRWPTVPFGIVDFVEAQMQRAARAESHFVWTDGFAVGEKQHDLNMCIGVAGIQRARRLVAE
ncbi:hypothetical protein NFE57_15540 [Hephaestia sp. MAHUQ-44]|nr:hypothetical protein [Hephaestia sp. MAHUQ-44]MCM8732381.1 hypothetical protein [Hephaestia sp. MAHUQ-44]